MEAIKCGKIFLLSLFILAASGCSFEKIPAEDVNCIGYIKLHGYPKAETVIIKHKRGDSYHTNGKPFFLKGGWMRADTFDKIVCEK